jgi:hypothetical protein
MRTTKPRTVVRGSRLSGLVQALLLVAPLVGVVGTEALQLPDFGLETVDAGRTWIRPSRSFVRIFLGRQSLATRQMRAPLVAALVIMSLPIRALVRGRTLPGAILIRVTDDHALRKLQEPVERRALTDVSRSRVRASLWRSEPLRPISEPGGRYDLTRRRTQGPLSRRLERVFYWLDGAAGLVGQALSSPVRAWPRARPWPGDRGLAAVHGVAQGSTASSGTGE